MSDPGERRSKPQRPVPRSWAWRAAVARAMQSSIDSFVRSATARAWSAPGDAVTGNPVAVAACAVSEEGGSMAGTCPVAGGDDAALSHRRL
jgi:hypothetical protein